MQQIDITSETNGGHVIKLVDATPGMEREITVAAPSPGKKTMSDALVNLMPIPDETPETTLQHATAALDDITIQTATSMWTSATSTLSAERP